jgi:hypothetical protein
MRERNARRFIIPPLLTPSVLRAACGPGPAVRRRAPRAVLRVRAGRAPPGCGGPDSRPAGAATGRLGTLASRPPAQAARATSSIPGTGSLPSRARLRHTYGPLARPRGQEAGSAWGDASSGALRAAASALRCCRAAGARSSGMPSHRPGGDTVRAASSRVFIGSSVQPPAASQGHAGRGDVTIPMGLSRNVPNARRGRAAHRVPERAVATARKGRPARASSCDPRPAPDPVFHDLPALLALPGLQHEHVTARPPARPPVGNDAPIKLLETTRLTVRPRGRREKVCIGIGEVAQVVVKPERSVPHLSPAVTADGRPPPC